MWATLLRCPHIHRRPRATERGRWRGCGVSGKIGGARRRGTDIAKPDRSAVWAFTNDMRSRMCRGSVVQDLSMRSLRISSSCLPALRSRPDLLRRNLCTTSPPPSPKGSSATLSGNPAWCRTVRSYRCFKLRPASARWLRTNHSGAPTAARAPAEHTRHARLAADAYHRNHASGCAKCARGEGHPLAVLTVSYPGGPAAAATPDTS
jgi:hypothetical protein